MLTVPKKNVSDVKQFEFIDKKTKEKIQSNVGAMKFKVDNIQLYTKVFKVIENGKNYIFNYIVNFNKDITAMDENGVVYEITPEEFITGIEEYIQLKN